MSERFHHVTVHGYPFSIGTTSGKAKEGLSASVIDTAYGAEIAVYRSEATQRRFVRLRAGDPCYGYVCPGCGRWKSRRNATCRMCARPKRVFGVQGALEAAKRRCAELNEWDEREGSEPLPPFGLLAARG